MAHEIWKLHDVQILVSIHKLEDTLTPSITYGLGLFSCYNGRAEELLQSLYGLQGLKYFLSDPLGKSVSIPNLQNDEQGERKAGISSWNTSQSILRNLEKPLNRLGWR